MSETGRHILNGLLLILVFSLLFYVGYLIVTAPTIDEPHIADENKVEMIHSPEQDIKIHRFHTGLFHQKWIDVYEITIDGKQYLVSSKHITEK